MVSSIIEKILVALLMVLLMGAILIIFNEDAKYIYECTDYAGNIIHCTYAYESKGGMFGYMEDGTKISITSYKRVLREE